MSKIRKVSAAVLLCMAVLLLVLPEAHAAARIDTEHDASLTLNYHYGEIPVSGATFSLYYVAAVDPVCSYTLAGPFADYPVEVNDNTVESWNELAETLKGYVFYDNVKPVVSGITGSSGSIRFGGLKPGLYLLTGNSRTVGDYTYYCQATVIAIPGLDQTTDEWVYDVTAEPKCSRRDADVPYDKTVTRKVLKVWDDNGSASRPGEVIIQLYCGAKLYDTVTLNADNNWRYAWDNLPSHNANREKNEWTVVEKPVDGYTVAVQKQGITFTVTNSKHSPSPVHPSLPQTGALWWPVPVLLFVGLALVLTGVIRRRGSCHEE